MLPIAQCNFQCKLTARGQFSRMSWKCMNSLSAFFQLEQQVQWLDMNWVGGLRASLPHVLVFTQIQVSNISDCPFPGLCFHLGASCWRWLGQRSGWEHGPKITAGLQNAVPFIGRGKGGNPAVFHNWKSYKTRNALLKLQKFLVISVLNI